MVSTLSFALALSLSACSCVLVATSVAATFAKCLCILCIIGAVYLSRKSCAGLNPKINRKTHLYTCTLTLKLCHHSRNIQMSTAVPKIIPKTQKGNQSECDVHLHHSSIDTHTRTHTPAYQCNRIPFRPLRRINIITIGKKQHGIHSPDMIQILCVRVCIG